MLRRRNSSLRELVRTQHGEFMRCQAKRDEEFRRRDEEMKAESQRRDEKMREEFQRRDEEMREFNREILLRNEKVYTALIAEMEEGRKQLAEGTRQIQANTRAVLSVLDRLDEAA